MTSALRADAISWMLQVHHAFNMQFDSTLYLAVNYMDRYLTRHAVAPEGLQHLAMACFSAASKMHELRYPRLEDLVTFGEQVCSEDEAEEMEVALCEALDHHLMIPTAKVCLPCSGLGQQ